MIPPIWLALLFLLFDFWFGFLSVPKLSSRVSPSVGKTSGPRGFRLPGGGYHHLGVLSDFGVSMPQTGDDIRYSREAELVQLANWIPQALF